MPRHEVSRPRLAPFQLCGLLRWAEHGHTDECERVGDSMPQWDLRANDHKIDVVVKCPAGKLIALRFRVDRHGEILGQQGGTAVAWGTVSFGHVGAGGQLPDNSVLSRATAHYQNSHSPVSPLPEVALLCHMPWSLGKQGQPIQRALPKM